MTQNLSHAPTTGAIHKNSTGKANMMNLKMTQQHLTQGFKFANMVDPGKMSTTASTNNA